MPYYKENWDALSEKKQKILQIIVGILLGAGSTVSLLLSTPAGQDASPISFGFLIAIALVLVVPRVLDAQTGAQLKVLRVSMIISLIVGIASTAIVGIIIGSA